MFEDWAITPPSSPRGGKQNARSSTLDDTSRESFEVADDWDTCMFCCMGEPHSSNAAFHESSYLQKNDLSIFTDEDSGSVFLSSDFDKLHLFGHDFDKGSALINNMSTLFRMARHSYMQLDSLARANVNSLGLNVACRKIGSFVAHREDIVRFFMYLRNYVRRVSTCSKYTWMIENFCTKLNTELTAFILLSGSISSVPDYIINYSASSAGNKCTQLSYHVFHCQLDIKWLYITLLYQLVQCKQRFNENVESQVNDSSLTYEALENSILHVVSDLVFIALKRFNQISLNELPSKTLFTCTCVRELWRLLQLSVDGLHDKGRTMPFWVYVNQVCERISESPIRKSSGSSLASDPSRSYSCSNPTAFTLWLLKHLGKLYTVNNKSPAKSNYALLESCIRLCVNSEIPESQMRVYLHLVESILNVGWELRTEPLVLLWEYFHKRLNSSFLIMGAPIGGLAIISKSAMGLITQLNNKLESHNPEKNSDSFHMFLRLIGNNLRKWQDTPRFWNQLKGRIFSKFSAAKLLTLNETGMYHFISLFLTLVMTADLQVSATLQAFLKQLPTQELDEARMKLIWKAHMALILIFAERNQDISAISSPLLDMVEVVVNQPDCLCLMRIFSEGFQDLVDCTNNLELGQYMFFGNWISSFLSRCSESDTSQFLDSLLSLISKLNSIMSAQLPLGQDNQLILLHNAVWEHLTPYLKKTSSSPSSPYQISDIAALLTTLSLRPCFSPGVKSKAIDLFTFFISHEMVDIRLLCRYLGQVSRSIHLNSSLNNHSITLIKGWIRCLILISGDNNCNEDLTQFTNYVITISEIQQLLSETVVSMSSESDYFETFLIALQIKYSSLQDIHSRNRFANQVSSYFSNVDRWLSYTVKTPKSVDLAMNIYQNVGQLFLKIPQLLYTKSKPNSLLQCFLDLLLLPVQVRNPQFKLNPHVSEAIRSTLYLYINGLFKLGPENDAYIARCIRELITVYVPRLVTPKGTILTYGNARFSLSKCFENSEYFETMSKTILEIVCSSFIKRRSKTPHQYQFQFDWFYVLRSQRSFSFFLTMCSVHLLVDPVVTIIGAPVGNLFSARVDLQQMFSFYRYSILEMALIFLNSIVRLYKNDNRVIRCFLQNVFERVCDVIMFCDDMSPCKAEAKDLINFILDMHLLRSDSALSDDLMNVFSKLSHEHLAFTARNLFDLFEDVVTVAPDLVARFLPQFTDKIKEVECKRGVGFDRALRKGLERIEDALKNIRNVQRSTAY